MTTITSLKKADGNFSIVEDGRVVFETNAARKSFNLVPSGAIHVTGYELMYPDLNVTNAYHWDRAHTSTNHYTEGCDSFITVPPQEWGPDKTLLLADADLGALPKGTEFLSVRMKMDHTVLPDAWFGKPINEIIKPGQWVDLGEDAATLVEGFTNYLQRMVSFHIDATDPDNPRCKLRRRQSTFRASNSFWADGNSSTVNGWSHGGTDGADAVFVKLRQSKGPTDFFVPSDVPTTHYQRGGDSPCATSDNLNLASVWTGEIIVTPGRQSAAS